MNLTRLTIVLIITSLALSAEVISNPPAKAQKTAKVIGVVGDETGAVIPDASVTVQNDETTRKTVTDDGGEFEIELPEGVYRIIVEKRDFCKYKQEGLEVRADKKEQIDIILQPQATHRSCP
ncbi:MAG TPA: carboxypeptidase-like regulatory domain-containing protein [Blastocatellia bacterium]|nr:carboxypeptidase-like regulatory domain-containing protein [Blastocatellia bacterium]